MPHTMANAIRMLAIDAVQKANSGHPGMPMGMADIAEVLWRKYLKHNPGHPHWINRDRFMLSNGHGSALLYALLYLTGYDMTLEDLKQFRQFHSRTPGHPEVHETPGVETTTGPLGQGLANAVGMAIAEKHVAARFNRPSHEVIDHHTFVFMGDGCLMEGISHEVCSLAGTLGLNKLIAFWDDNGISIDGPVQGWFTDNTPQRFESYGWHVIANVDGHNAQDIDHAIAQALKSTDKPTLICCKTTIGWGSPKKAGKETSHGSPLGADEIAKVREIYNWPHAPFEIPEEILWAWDGREAGHEREMAWQEKFHAYEQAYPELARELTRCMSGLLPLTSDDFFKNLLQQFQGKNDKVATRQASLMVLEALKSELPELLGGSADLTGSNLTRAGELQTLTAKHPQGQYLYYGVREFGMAAIMNGLALHGGVIPFGGTFLVFSDYARNAIRMSALMQQRVIFVMTHDSIGLGEDGPTHQPVEHLASLRLIPQLNVWRPCDVVETAAAWQSALMTQGPTVLGLSRQTCAPQQRDAQQLQEIARGGYVLKKAIQPALIFIATGSEVGLATDAAAQLEAKGYAIQVVSMPCVDIFYQQDAAYQAQVLHAQVPLVVIEAGVSDAWYRLVKNRGIIMGLDHFGASAPAPELFEHFGFSVERAVALGESLIQSHS